MIVFALYLHVCMTQQTMRVAPGLGSTVTSCSLQASGRLYSSQALCVTAGKAEVATAPGATDIADVSRRVDAYECRTQTVATK